MQPANSRALNRIGDDAAVWQPSRSHRSVITTDALIEGMHFSSERMRMQDIGYRAMAASLSDLAAMGAKPVLSTVALGLPSSANIEDVLELYRGMLELAIACRCALAGGDVIRAPQLIISITAVGEVRANRVRGRAGGRPGDVVVVTGPLGASRAGLHVLAGAAELEEPLRSQALRAHCRPEPRLREGAWLAASTYVHALMDVSDGLSTDLARLCEASGCGAVVHDVPVAASAAGMAKKLGDDPAQYALAGGEDYELIATLPARAFVHLSRRFQKRFRKPLLRVAELSAGSGIVMLREGNRTPVPRIGWDHFAHRER